MSSVGVSCPVALSSVVGSRRVWSYCRVQCRSVLFRRIVSFGLALVWFCRRVKYRAVALSKVARYSFVRISHEQSHCNVTSVLVQSHCLVRSSRVMFCLVAKTSQIAYSLVALSSIVKSGLVALSCFVRPCPVVFRRIVW